MGEGQFWDPTLPDLSEGWVLDDSDRLGGTYGRTRKRSADNAGEKFLRRT